MRILLPIVASALVLAIAWPSSDEVRPAGAVHAPPRPCLGGRVELLDAGEDQPCPVARDGFLERGHGLLDARAFALVEEVGVGGEGALRRGEDALRFDPPLGEPSLLEVLLAVVERVRVE